MLDAYIIDRIRQNEREEQKDSRVPLHIHVPTPPTPQPPQPRSEQPDGRDRGAEIVDYRL